MNALQVILDLFLGGAWLATFIPLVRGNIRKETVVQQAELIKSLTSKIEGLENQNKAQQQLIDRQDIINAALTARIKLLEEGRADGKPGVVHKRPPNRDGRGGHP